MKELTTEQKTKAYDEAINKAKSLYKAAEPMSGCNVLLETIFPELKENEDEQSKKWILEYLYDGLRKSDEQFKGQFKATIAWLEKQCNKDEEILILKDQIESLHAAIKAIKETHRVELEKQGEQILANSFKTCKDEQNLAWSEEDEKKNEDEAIRSNSIPELPSSAFRLGFKLGWFKALRPQNTWKPSDEQMNALKDACDKHWEPDGLDSLYTLWEQLKKLKE